MKIMMHQVLLGKIKMIWVGSLCVFLNHPGLVFGQSIPPRPPRPPRPMVRLETEAERLEREKPGMGKEKSDNLTREERVAEMIRTGRIVARPGDPNRANPNGIRPSFEPARGAQTSQPPVEPARVPTSQQGAIEQPKSGESIAIRTLRVRIAAEKDPMYREMLEAELLRLLNPK